MNNIRKFLITLFLILAFIIAFTLYNSNNEVYAATADSYIDSIRNSLLWSFRPLLNIMSSDEKKEVILYVDTGSQKVQFVRFQIDYNPFDLNLERIDLTGPFTKEIVNTPLDKSNSSGFYNLALGLEPGKAKDGVSGKVEIAKLLFKPMTKSLNRKIAINYSLYIGNTSRYAQQLIDIKGNNLTSVFGSNFRKETSEIILNPKIENGTIPRCNYLNSWGSKGSEPGNFNSPSSIAVYPLDPGDESEKNQIIFVLDSGNNRFQEFDYKGNLLGVWGSAGSGGGQLNNPKGFAHDPGGIYIVDTGNNRISFWIDDIDPYQAVFMSNFGSYGSGNGQFKNPQDITSAYSYTNMLYGYLYIADTGNNRIQKIYCSYFTGKCNFEKILGSYGTGDGQFIKPSSVTVDYVNGDLYVADSTNRIQRFSKDGNFITSWGTNGSEEAKFIGPLSLSADPLSNVYVSDSGRNKIIKFTNYGQYLNEWGEKGNGEYKFNGALDIAVENDNYSDGNFFVADTGNNRIIRYQCAKFYCQYDKKWGSEGSSDGEFKYIYALAVDKKGNTFVSDTNSANNNRIQKFDKDGQFVKSWGITGTEPGQLSLISSMDVDSENNLYVGDYHNERIQVFDNEGNFLRMWPTRGDFEYKFPVGITLDNDNNVYVSIEGNFPLIQKFDNQGNFINEWGKRGIFSLYDGEFRSLKGLEYNNNGNLYVTDEGANQINVFDNNGNFINKFGKLGSQGGQYGNALGRFHDPNDVTTDYGGNVYVSDTANNRIQVFSKDGFPLSEIGQWNGQSSSASGQLHTPLSIAYDKIRNYLYVADSGNYRIQRFSCNLSQLSFVDGDGNGDGKVDIIDYRIFISHYTRSGMSIEGGDYNKDGTVDGVDYVIWFNNYGRW
ncbi:hypothetical protein A2955_04420 [Candidatus Woesebacteria bacterium RIFCSPLOWO2_01_FULL_37_19]|uniref:Dockerin domain-containing protein n=1 Tax=Candidatus Woesebacteria bacterium RIFCSPLOWO2_01_FULL_37_19 TaxID=1802514 RepID=A0A1F8B4Q9_9BACT|nr:MAG: hypothetical protein A2955_04420 [Candidatus Woesebacteria bacterium RIFCSPLOWO2_01_FULL_37_19]